MIRWSALALGALVLVGCSEDDPTCAQRAVTTDAACDISQDCIDAGYQGLTCVDGLCRRICQVDADCRPSPDEGTDEPEMCKAMADPRENAVCEAQLCASGCPDVACEAGEQCVEGRCLYFFEGFELRDENDVADLGRFGWNDIETELENVQTTIVYEGLRGCSLGDDSCAGPGAEGVRFVSLERTVTQAKGTAVTDSTCRPCACCLECLFDTESTSPPQISSCGTTRPSPLTCPSSTPMHCQAVCEQCNACPAADASRIQERLVACEVSVAERTCPSCLTCETDKVACRDAMCPTCAAEPNGNDCVQCVNDNCLGSASCQSCRVCDDATDCAVTDPGSAACVAAEAACEALGVDGCFPAAVGYLRSQLEDIEQALVSPPIDLSGATGDIVLEFLHVPFDVGESYRPGIQGTQPDQWPVAPQQVRIELCGGGCETADNWAAGELSAGGTAVIPPPNRRRNGLLLGTQTLLDWQGGQVRVRVPDGLRTSTFRFRFVPDIAEDTRVGVDTITVRRLR